MRAATRQFSGTAEKIQMRDVARQLQISFTPGRWIRPIVGLVALAIPTAYSNSFAADATEGDAQVRMVRVQETQTSADGGSYFAASVLPSAGDRLL